MILLVFLATLVGLSVVGLAERARSSEHRAVGPCAAVSSVAFKFQAAVTDDLRNHTRLHSDTHRFIGELRSLDAANCPETRRFLRTASLTIGALCKDCVDELRRTPTVTG
jgi:hypothetical protein